MDFAIFGIFADPCWAHHAEDLAASELKQEDDQYLDHDKDQEDVDRK